MYTIGFNQKTLNVAGAGVFKVYLDVHYGRNIKKKERSRGKFICDQYLLI